MPHVNTSNHPQHPPPTRAQFKAFATVFAFLNLDIFNAPVFACQSMGDNFYKRFMLHAFGTACIIAALVLLLACTSVMKRLVARTCLTSAGIWNVLLYFLFLVYPSISATVIRMMRCRVIDGKSYLLADFSLRCDADEYQPYRRLAIFFIMVYPVGILVFFIGILAWNKRNLPPDWWPCPGNQGKEARKAYDMHRALPGNSAVVFEDWHEEKWLPRMAGYEKINGRLGFLFNACKLCTAHAKRLHLFAQLLTLHPPFRSLRRHATLLVVRGRADDLQAHHDGLR